MTARAQGENTTKLEALVEKSASVRAASADLLRTVRSRIERAFGSSYTEGPPEEEEGDEQQKKPPDIQAIGNNMEIVHVRLRLIHGWLEGLLNQDSKGSAGSEKEVKRSPMNELREQSKSLVELSVLTQGFMEDFIGGIIGEATDEESKDEGICDKICDDDVSIMDDEFDKVCTCLERIRCLAERL